MNTLTWFKTEEEKILITDSVQNANALIKRYNSEGHTISNVTVTTISAIAKELLIRNLASKGELRRIREVTDDVGAFIIEGILRSNPERYSFVPKESLCTATASEILTNINLIRENELNSEFSGSDDKKLAELKRLNTEYEEKLSELGLMDRCMLLREGLRIACNEDEKAHASVALLFSEELTTLERQFLGALCPDAEVLSYEDRNDNTVWQFNKSYGTWNEANAILEDITNRKIPFGQVQIVYTSDEYENVLLSAFGERRVPIRFTGGRAIAGTNTVRMLLSLIAWAEQGYRYEDLKPIVLNPLFMIPSETEGVGIFGLSEFLKGIKDNIGWRLDRYEDFLKKYGEAEKSSDENGEAHGRHSKEYLTFLQDAVLLFRDIHAPVRADRLLSGMFRFVKKYSRGAEEKKLTVPLLDAEIKKLAYMLPSDSLSETLKLLTDRLEKLNVKDEEDPGCVSACTLNGVTIFDRPYVYVIGLSDKHYGIRPIESPVLNDEERERYFRISAGKVQLSKDSFSKRLEDYMTSFRISGMREIHVGYASFDTVTQEPLSPSALYLNLLENFGEGASPVLAEYPGVIAENTLVSKEKVWGSEAAGSKTKEASTDAAETACDRKEVDLQFSPSALDSLLSCPAKYNYQRNRYITEEDYSTPDSSVWLGADERGIYFHLILQEYITKMFIGKDVILPEPDMDVFNDIFKAATMRTLEKVPVESAAVARQEQEDIREAAIRYLKRLHKEFSDPDCPWHVLACEKNFGRDGVPGLQKDYDIVILKQFTLSGKTDAHDLFHITFNGIIDRLDGYTDSDGVQHFRIVDYKSGTKANFVKYKMDSSQRHVTTQHSIYMMYLRESGEGGVVEEFDYHFPFEEEEADLEIRIESAGDVMTDNDDAILKALHWIFVDGNYSPNTSGGSCTFCKYKDICLAHIE